MIQTSFWFFFCFFYDFSLGSFFISLSLGKGMNGGTTNKGSL